MPRAYLESYSTSRLAVSKTKDISCDGASQLLGPSLCDENGEDSCDVASRVPFAGYTS